MFAEMMQSGVATEEKRPQYLRIIMAEAERLTRLINNVLDFARLERKQKRYDFRALDLHDVIARTWEGQELHLRENGFSTSWQAAPPPYPVTGDEDALAQILVNLLSNAEKYSGEKKEVELHSYTADGSVFVSVLDRGSGVPRGRGRENLRGLLSRARFALQRHPGLRARADPRATSRERTRRRDQVSSARRRREQFHLAGAARSGGPEMRQDAATRFRGAHASRRAGCGILPKRTFAATPRTQPPLPRKFASGRMPETSTPAGVRSPECVRQSTRLVEMKKHILVVEDDAHIRLGLCDALRAEAYEVTECRDGAHAGPLIKQTKPDLVILDIMLPGKSGFDLCREIRAAKNRVPILMLSAKGQEIDKVVGLELGADDYVTKPFSLRELLARVQALLRRAQAGGAASDLPAEIAFGKVRIDTKALRGKRGKEAIELTPREMKVLAVLFRERGNAVSREGLLNEVWGIDYYGTTRTLDQLIVKLRQKIEDVPGEPRHLLTVHTLGYRLDV